jgi:hypothetical protein
MAQLGFDQMVSQEQTALILLDKHPMLAKRDMERCGNLHTPERLVTTM